MPSAKVKRAIRLFERAVEHKTLEGSIPYNSDDPEEQAELDALHLSIQHNYVKARAKLERLMENL